MSIDPRLTMLLEGLGVDTDSLDGAAIESAIGLVRELASRPKTPLTPQKEKGKKTSNVKVTDSNGNSIEVEIFTVSSEHSANCECSECQEKR